MDGAWPSSTAASWDRVGLQVGDPEWEVATVLVSLDVTPDVVAEAAAHADGGHALVLAHHPLLFRPLDRLTPDTASGRTALAAAGAGVAVAAAHTNLDVATDGVGTSDPVADLLGLVDVEPVTRDDGPDRLRLVTFVPVDDVEQVVDALAAAGAGAQGDYERCAFVVHGTGTFTPLPGAAPAIGDVGDRVEVTEARVEMDLPAGIAGTVVTALRDAHPYEEVAFDLVTVRPEPRAGFGRVGNLPTPQPLRAVAAAIRDGLPSPHLRYAGEPDRLVRRVAVVGGAGDSLIDAARATGADVYVTGDLRHHVTLDAVTMGMALVDAGHHAVEQAAMPVWRRRLQELAEARGLTAPVLASGVDTSVWRGGTE